jgi:uncharacterized membrane protein YfcA
MEPVTLALIAAMMFGGAVLYSTVGHAGASAYLAIMALFALPPEVMRPTALVLNILVSSIATWRYARAGLFDWKLFWPFAVTAVPAAWLAGGVQLPADVYRPLLGVVLLLSAARLIWPAPVRALGVIRPPLLPVALATGAFVGALSGLVGVGGGIFLSPIILFLGWAAPRTTSGTIAPFILVVSASGLAGNLASVGALPPELPWFALAVIAGGFVGTWLGSKRLSPRGILYALAAVELVAAWKLLTA